MQCSRSYFLILILFTITTSDALATLITPGVTSGAGGTATISVAPSSRGGSNHFEVAKNFTTLGPIDIVLNAIPSGAAPASDQTFSERVANNTGVSWFDFHVEIGTGTGSGFIRLNTTTPFYISAGSSECSSITSTDFGVGLGPNCGLMPFRATMSNTAVDFLSTSPDITAQNAQAVENGHQLNLSFVMRVPNTTQSYTLRQIPTTDGKVNEPITIALTLAGLGALCFTRRKGSVAKNRKRSAP